MQHFHDEFITLSHGGGGKASQRLIQHIFGRALANDTLHQWNDAAVFDFDRTRLAFTTDSFVIDPIFFPGGDIGSLAVHGTVNDLCTAGAVPKFLSLGVILEEGFAVAELRRIADSLAAAAGRCGVQVVTGDTKVVPRGKADRIFINTAGIGLVQVPHPPSLSRAAVGDAILLSGPIGNHGITILAARGDLDLEIDTQSDSAPLHELTAAVLAACPNVHCLKDPTRGGLATSLNEIAAASQVGIEIEERAIPIDTAVRGACEILGLDPLEVANEGKLIVIVPQADAEAVMAAMRSDPLGRRSCRIGTVVEQHRNTVLLHTALGGQRVVEMPVGQSLPRIC